MKASVSAGCPGGQQLAGLGQSMHDEGVGRRSDFAFGDDGLRLLELGLRPSQVAPGLLDLPAPRALAQQPQPVLGRLQRGARAIDLGLRAVDVALGADLPGQEKRLSLELALGRFDRRTAIARRPPRPRQPPPCGFRLRDL